MKPVLLFAASAWCGASMLLAQDARHPNAPSASSRLKLGVGGLPRNPKRKRGWSCHLRFVLAYASGYDAAAVPKDLALTTH
jgi:hypothetical protein